MFTVEIDVISWSTIGMFDVGGMELLIRSKCSTLPKNMKNE